MFVEQPRSLLVTPGSAPVAPGSWSAPPADAAGRTADPADPAAVAAALLDDLGRRLGLPGLGYAEPPAPLAGGWENYLYGFRLRGPGLPPAWDRPLVLRVHAHRRGVQR